MKNRELEMIRFCVIHAPFYLGGIFKVIGLKTINSYSISDIVDDVQALVAEGKEEMTAKIIAFNLAREAFRTANPDKPFPEYLRGKCNDSYDKELRRREQENVGKTES